MELSQLLQKELSGYASSIVHCQCGRTHTLQVAEILNTSCCIERMGAVMRTVLPVGSAAVLCCATDEFERVGSVAERYLRRGGYLIKRELIEQSNVNAPLKMTLSEDLRCIVAVGDCIESAKLFANECGLPLIAVPTTQWNLNLLLSQAVKSDGTIKLAQTKPVRALLADPTFLEFNDENAAAMFGELVSCLPGLFDWRLSACLRGEHFCSFIANELAREVRKAIQKVKGNEKNHKEILPILGSSILKCSALMQLSGYRGFSCNGVNALNNCLKLLFKNEDRNIKQDGENKFLFSLMAIKVYRQVLAQPSLGFYPPPCNNLRMDTMTDFLGIDHQVAAYSVAPYPTAEQNKLDCYRLQEYKNELYDYAVEINALLSEAYAVFKRIYRDDGFSLLNYIDQPDAQLCFALAPDVTKGFSMLNILKNMGVLDQYIAG